MLCQIRELSVCPAVVGNGPNDPLTYGSTAVDLISGAGSFVAVCFFVFMFSETKTDNLYRQDLLRGVSFLER